jgi:hypothetical protein
VNKDNELYFSLGEAYVSRSYQAAETPKSAAEQKTERKSPSVTEPCQKPQSSKRSKPAGLHPPPKKYDSSTLADPLPGCSGNDIDSLAALIMNPDGKRLGFEQNAPFKNIHSHPIERRSRNPTNEQTNKEQGITK